MKRKAIFATVLLGLGAVLLTVLLSHAQNAAILNPKGLIALKERNLMVTAVLLMLIVVVPVYALTFGIAWRYRAGNTKAKYTPDWDHHRLIEFTWWAVPLAIITVLAVITWKSSHELDPYRALESDKRPVTIQVVALQWKWLFIYPEQKIATVNYIQFPEQTPVNFEITADSPMNSFWIPELGGQIYAMNGMKTKLHLIADKQGVYNGSSANISGEGFAGMKFIAQSTSKGDFEKWVRSVQQSPDGLTLDEYNKLAKPSQNNPLAYYTLKDDDLYDKVIMKFMFPSGDEVNSGAYAQ